MAILAVFDPSYCVHVRRKVYIAPFYVRSKDCKFAPHLERSNADLAPHSEGSHADFAPHMELRHSFRDQQIAIIAVSSIFCCFLPDPRRAGLEQAFQFSYVRTLVRPYVRL